MTETVLSFPIDIGDILDVDLKPDGSLLSIQGFGKRQILMLPQGFVELPESWTASEFPHLRVIAPDRLLLIDASGPAITDENAFILNEAGQVVTRFPLGAGVIDAVPTGGAIAVAYHPDAALEFGLSASPLAATGIAIFDGAGQMVANLNHDLEQDGWQAQNIQCLCVRETGELVLIPEFLSGPHQELDSPIVFYDWRSGLWRHEETIYSRPLAISSKENRLFLYSPEESEDELIECDLLGRRIKSLGFFQHVYRGLTAGRFLAQLSGVEYSLLEMNPEPALRTHTGGDNDGKKQRKVERLARLT